MKLVLKYFYIFLFLGALTLSACSDDDPTQDDPKHEQPDNPNDNSDSSSKVVGKWVFEDFNFGGIANVQSTSRVEFGKSDSLTISWYDKNNPNKPYSVAKGEYSTKGDSLKLEWKNVMTDTIVNTAFNTLYLAGGYSIKNDQMNYDYSVYDISGEKLSGPHNIKLTNSK